MTSCINDYADCKEPQKEVSLNFKILSSNISLTRAADVNGHEETDSDWPQFEDLIDEDRLAIFIFGEAADGSWPVLLRMTDLEAEREGNDEPDVTIEAFPGFYDIKARIESDKFQNIIGRSLRWGIGNSLKLRVVAIANTTGVDYDAIDASTYDTFMNGVAATAETAERPGAKTLTYKMGDVIKTGVTGDHNVADYYQGAIPMFGLGEFTISDDMLIDSNNVNYAMVGEVHMQRSLAKICVIDNIQNRNPETMLPRIESVAVRSRTQIGYVLPSNPLSYENNDRLNAVYQAPSATLATYLLGYLQEVKPASPAGLVRFGYLPEQQYNEVAAGTAPAPDPYIVITVTFAVDETGVPTEQKTYYVSFSGYDGNSFSENFGSSILRNHIYTLSVDRVRIDTDLDLTIQVKEWEEVDFELEYTDQPSVDPLSWVDTWYQSYDSESGTVIVKPFTNVPTPVIASFGLLTPQGATWSASLLPLEGETDAFYFVKLKANGSPEYDEYGNLIMLAPSEVGGVINSSKPNCRLGIAPSVANPDGIQRAMLQVFITIGEGSSATVTQVDLTGSNTSFSNFTILQNP